MMNGATHTRPNLTMPAVSPPDIRARLQDWRARLKDAVVLFTDLPELRADLREARGAIKYLRAANQRHVDDEKKLKAATADLEAARNEIARLEAELATRPPLPGKDR